MWPNVTVPDWSARAERLAKGAGANRVVLMPIVEDSERQEWEEYSMANVAPYYENSIQNEGLEDSVEFYLNRTSPKIFHFENGNYSEPTIETEPGPWLVAWQNYPLDKDLITTNHNMLYPERVANAFYTTAATLEPTISFLVLFDKAESQIIQPIFQDVGNGVSNKRLVGATGIVIDWESYFEGVLEDGANGITVVMKTSCDDFGGVTYLVEGSEATYIGEGDQHDPNYDSMEISAPFVSIEYDESKNDDNIYVQAYHQKISMCNQKKPSLRTSWS